MVSRGVVGIDLSLRATGLCVATGDPHSTVDRDITATATVMEVGQTLRGPARLSVLTNAIWLWTFRQREPIPGDLYVMEGYAFSAQQAHSLGEIGGCLKRMIWESGGNLIVIPPSTLKKFMTGKGTGDKNLVMKHVYKRWKFDADDDNACDAFGCAMLGLLYAAGPKQWTKAEAELLKAKVQRYAGQGQASWAPIDAATVPRRSRRSAVADE